MGREGFEPSKPKQRSYSPSHLTALESPQKWTLWDVYCSKGNAKVVLFFSLQKLIAKKMNYFLLFFQNTHIQTYSPLYKSWNSKKKYQERIEIWSMFSSSSLQRQGVSQKLTGFPSVEKTSKYFSQLYNSGWLLTLP